MKSDGKSGTTDEMSELKREKKRKNREKKKKNKTNKLTMKSITSSFSEKHIKFHLANGKFFNFSSQPVP